MRLYAAADAVRKAHGYYSPLFIQQPYYDRTLAAARAQLGETAFADAWDEGGAMTPQEVISAGADTQPLVGVDAGFSGEAIRASISQSRWTHRSRGRGAASAGTGTLE